MDMAGYHLPSLVGVGAAFAAVYGAFAKFDNDQSEKNRKFVRDWLTGLKVDDRSWNQFFHELFSKFFGIRHLSLKCLRRSFLLSAFLMIGIFTFLYLKVPDFFNVQGLFNRMVVFSPLLIIAGIADYFSLWKTQILLTNANLLWILRTIQCGRSDTSRQQPAR